MTPPLITILLPTFHRRDFLPAAIRSIHDQSFANWRLLVLNDGGEDVADIVAGFGDPRIEYHALPHRGKGATLNAGLALVQSKYIAYMDDDDLVYPDHLEELVAFAEREKAEFVYSDTWAVWIGLDGGELRRQIENEDDVSFDDIRFFNKINHKQILHTKRLADKVGPYDERMRILIDYDYIRRLARAAKPAHLRKTTGEHFLRQATERDQDFSSITGLWVSDPATCGRSIAALFEKDPAALADLYRFALRDRNRSAVLERQLRAEKANLRDEKDRHAKSLDALAATRQRLQEVGNRVKVLETSFSFRLGQALTAPFRFVIEALRRCRR